MYSLLGISGSLRAEATNRKLLREAARLFDASDYTEANLNLPLYNTDLETAKGIPASVISLANEIEKANAVIISTPEYNKGPSGVLKNALDWVSRTSQQTWRDKPVAIMSASAGRAGGERAQFVLRGFMVPFRPRILQGPEVHLANSNQQFDEKGHLISNVYLDSLQELMNDLRQEVERSI
ncbi:MAG: NAD(P)H-dependent oxidoreductase [Aestuariivita sp.]|nr:NAD(P)H-dependent oxidoreductase [Aestuariivita sp.]